MSNFQNIINTNKGIYYARDVAPFSDCTEKVGINKEIKPIAYNLLIKLSISISSMENVCSVKVRIMNIHDGAV